MKLALPFALNNEFYTERTDEFNIRFNPNRNSIEKLLEFCEAFPNKRINIEYTDNNPKIPDILGLRVKHPEVYCRVKDGNMAKCAELIAQGVPAFMDSDLPAGNFSELGLFLSLGVSDIYIVDDLCYNMSDVYELCHERGIQTRMILNNIPSVIRDAGSYIKSPIFPPECVHLLDRYIDVAEFDCGKPFDWHRLGVYYRAWFERKDWHGNLQEIINGLNIPIPNDSLITDDWINFKMHCGRRCDARATSKCRKCEQMFNIATSLASKQIGVRREKNLGETE